ncbi:SidA/IucD/PvdA family monooxygenase [Granulicatella sp. zg-ZJ]|uniref:NAD(P)/FAD-dependent oxidoreductase n=1 Tax=unclassified Granulicatella TaxID=2630493 RepID=UPI0013C0DA2C|nr:MULTISPECIES: NAD(P)/FAD-dependent oxidoreductase [unclassified Granulicatella]NEW61996.1 SidA/IucD/PvdA family monooxygenase [Granulicatella sp. zg-ZJ]NEW65611.1 SidA/IucD/PvdA family monooxygenase [Granulicatella sp. zg-84]QMI85748.1 NAD(P)/FAD-dependent oxidoreductase [Carnobacteriaceae bacterium zg-84]
MTEIFDITIIGGGPIGLFTAFYAHLRQAKVKIIESLHQLGGQPIMLYPEKTILDVPAYPRLTGQTLSEKLLEQLSPFDTTVCLNETVLHIEKENEHFVLTTNQGTHFTKTVIIAIGAGAFKPRTLDLEGIDTFENIHYHVQNIEQYKDKDVVVLGGGDSAVDWSLAFEPIAKSTRIVHRRDEFRAMEHSVEQLKQSSINIHTPHLPTKLIGKDKKLSHIELTKVKTDETVTLPVDHLFVNYGFSTSVGNLKNWGLELKRNAIIVDTKQESSISGIFAVGDCCTYEGKVDLIASGFGEAPTAVNNAMVFINPKARVQPMHTTSL